MPAIKKLLFLLLIAAIAAFAGCKEYPPISDEGGLKITRVSISESFKVPAEGTGCHYSHSGFAVNNQIVFVPVTDAGKVYTATVTSVTGTGAGFTLPVRRGKITWQVPFG
jgi:hypothetical protein